MMARSAWAPALITPSDPGSPSTAAPFAVAMRSARGAVIQRSQSGSLMRLSSIENFACSNMLMALPLLPSEPSATFMPAFRRRTVGCSPLPSRRLLTGLFDDVYAPLGRDLDVACGAPDKMGKRAARADQAEPVEISDKAASVFRRSHQRLCLGLEDMGVQADAVTGGKISGQFEQMRCTALRPIDAEEKLQPVASPPFGRDLLHHCEIIFGRRRMRSKPALAHAGRQLCLINRQRVRIAPVLIHRCDRGA